MPLSKLTATDAGAATRGKINDAFDQVDLIPGIQASITTLGAQHDSQATAISARLPISTFETATANIYDAIGLRASSATVAALQTQVTSQGTQIGQRATTAQLDSAVAGLTTNINGRAPTAALTTEIADRTAADQALSVLIDSTAASLATESVARAAGDATEATARAAGDAAETAARNLALNPIKADVAQLKVDVVYNKAITDFQYGAVNGRAADEKAAREAAIADLEERKISYADADAIRGRDAGIEILSRPAAAPWAFLWSEGGVALPTEFEPLDETRPPADTAEGPGYRFTSGGHLVTRSFQEVLPGRAYQVTLMLMRVGTVADPSGDSAQLAVLCYDKNRQLITKVALQTWSSLSPGAITVGSKAFGRIDTPPGGVTALPAGTVFVRPDAAIYGGSQNTIVISLLMEDIDASGIAGSIVDAQAAAASAIGAANAANTVLNTVIAAAADFEASGAISAIDAGLDTRTAGERARDRIVLDEFWKAGDAPLNVSDDDSVERAIAYFTAKGGGTLHVKPGSYKRLETKLIEASHIHIEHEPGATIDCSELAFLSNNPEHRATGCAYKFQGTSFAATALQSDAAAGSYTVVVADAANFAIGQHVWVQSTQILQAQSGVPCYNINVNIVMGVNVGTKTLTLLYPLERAFAAATTQVWPSTMIRNVRVSGGYMTGHPAGAVPSLINGNGRVGVAAYAVNDLLVSDVHFDGFQGFAVYADRCGRVVVEHGRMDGCKPTQSIVENVTSGWYGFVANRCLIAKGVGIHGDRVRHLLDGADCSLFKQVDCEATMTHRAAFGSHAGIKKLLVEGCANRGGYGGFTLRALLAIVRDCDFESDALDCATTFVGEAGDVPSQLEIYDTDMVAKDPIRRALVINGTLNRLIVSGGYYYGGSGAIILQPYSLENFDISPSRMEVATANCIDTLTTYGLVRFRHGTISCRAMANFGTCGVVLRGSQTMAEPSDGIHVNDCKAYPSFEGSGAMIQFRGEGWWGDNNGARRNTFYNDSSAVVQVVSPAAGRFRSAIQEEDNVSFVVSTSVGTVDRRTDYCVGMTPTAGAATPATEGGDQTIISGSYVKNRKPAAGQVTRWYCTSSGTEGTITGVTGSIASGSTTLTLAGNDGAKVYPGCFLTVAGAGASSGALVRARVLTLSADFATATLSIAAGTTVSGAAVSRTAPTFKAGETLAA